MLCPRDSCGGKGADFTEELVFRSQSAMKRNYRALTQNFQFAKMLEWRCWAGHEAGKNSPGAVTGTE